MNKICKKHGSTPFSNGSKPRCKKCAVEAVTRKRQNLKLKAVEYKGGKCSVCGYNRYQGALEFHHLDPSKKDFGFGSSVVGWLKMKEELDKCILVCANCHREIHG